MKTVTSNALAELTKEIGTEPLIIIGIEWIAGNITYYCDKELTGVKAKILKIGAIESVVVSNRNSHNVSITLDDTDSELKGIIDQHNIHKVKCYVYQYYGALSSLDDKFLLFQGQINTPFSWDEKDRSISFSIVSEIESFEVGFSPEEGQLPFVNDEFVGKPWPLVFGNYVYVPAQKVSQTLEGKLLDSVCVVDELLYWKRDQITQQYAQQHFLFTFFSMAAQGANVLAPTVETLITNYIKAIISGRLLFQTVSSILAEIDTRNTNIRQGTNVGVAKAELTIYEGYLNFYSFTLNSQQLQTQQIENQIYLAEFKYNTQKEAYTRVIAAQAEMQSLYSDYVSIQSQICNQNQCVVPSVRIENGNNFPQGQELTLYLNDAKFRGTMEDDVFTFISSPTSKYENVAVATWHKDDDECVPDDRANGCNLFWLADSPPVNLVGLYILAKKKGEDSNFRHILKIDRQVGQKVYFSPVGWQNRTQGQPQGWSIDSVINDLLSTPFVFNKFGEGAPIDLFTGNWDESKWNSPEGKELLDIIHQIPGGVNAHELQLLALLVFLKPWDNAQESLLFDAPGPRDVFTLIGEDIDYIQEASGMLHKHWLRDYSIPFEEIPDSVYWTADVGSTVRLDSKDCSIYVANILPSIVRGVHAYRVLKNGSRVLAAVPSSYYTKNEMADLGSISVTSITFPFDLKNIAGEGWEDDIYVTLQSSIGPNVVDIIQWLIETYTTGTVNSANFAAVKAKFVSTGKELYPANFYLLDRPNVLEEVERIAFEARCAIYRYGNEFFLKYLSEEPTTDLTISESDICSVDDLQVAFPSTEGLITRMVAFWKSNGLPLQPGRKPTRIILRNNVKLYGLHSQDVEFHIYNIKELVYKSATFWMIRRSNTWKHLSFKTFLTNIRLDNFDTLLLSFAKEFVSTDDSKSVIQAIDYDTDNNLLSIDVELPIRAGEMIKYPFYWAASADSGAEFPSPFEIEHGFAGGYGPGSDVEGTINDC